MLIMYWFMAMMTFIASEVALFFFVIRVNIAKAGIAPANEGIAERLLDAIEPDLVKWGEEMGLPYIRPELSPEGKRLILNSPARFIKAYVRELRRAVRDNFNYVLV